VAPARKRPAPPPPRLIPIARAKGQVWKSAWIAARAIALWRE
jgi:hypothetical protein